jgi:hypothetical protein
MRGKSGKELRRKKSALAERLRSGLKRREHCFGELKLRTHNHGSLIVHHKIASKQIGASDFNRQVRPRLLFRLLGFGLLQHLGDRFSDAGEGRILTELQKLA